MACGAFGPPPTVDETIDELGGVPEPTPESLEPSEWPRAISGSPATIGMLLERMTDQVDADEVIIQNLIENTTDRIRSHELIADGVGLSDQIRRRSGRRSQIVGREISHARWNSTAFGLPAAGRYRAHHRHRIERNIDCFLVRTKS